MGKVLAIPPSINMIKIDDWDSVRRYFLIIIGDQNGGGEKKNDGYINPAGGLRSAIQ